MKTPFVRIDLSIEHAQAVGSLIDLATRIHAGQLSEILTLAESGALQVRDDRADRSRRNAGEDELGRIEDALTSLQRTLGHGSGSHFGIGAISDEAKRGYEAMKAIKKALHDHLRPDVRHVVDGDGVLVRYAGGPTPEALVVTE